MLRTADGDIKITADSTVPVGSVEFRDGASGKVLRSTSTHRIAEEVRKAMQAHKPTFDLRQAQERLQWLREERPTCNECDYFDARHVREGRIVVGNEPLWYHDVFADRVIRRCDACITPKYPWAHRVTAERLLEWLNANCKPGEWPDFDKMRRDMFGDCVTQPDPTADVESWLPQSAAGISAEIRRRYAEVDARRHGLIPSNRYLARASNCVHCFGSGCVDCEPR